MKYFIVGILLLLLSFVLFVLPSADIPNPSFLRSITGVDKIVHAGLFFILTISWCLPLRKKNIPHTSKKKWIVYIALAFVGYGITIEFIQQNFTTDRAFEKLDMLADIVGVGLAYVCVRFLITKDHATHLKNKLV